MINWKEINAFKQRIASGKAEPISEREKEQLKELQEVYFKRFNKKI